MPDQDARVKVDGTVMYPPRSGNYWRVEAIDGDQTEISREQSVGVERIFVPSSRLQYLKPVKCPVIGCGAVLPSAPEADEHWNLNHRGPNDGYIYNASPYKREGRAAVKNPTYAQEMKAKYGVPFDPKRVRSAHGFRYGDRVRCVRVDPYSGIQAGQTGTVDTVSPNTSVSPDPVRMLIMVKWDDGSFQSVPWRLLEKESKVKNPQGLPEQIYKHTADQSKAIQAAADLQSKGIITRIQMKRTGKGYRYTVYGSKRPGDSARNPAANCPGCNMPIEGDPAPGTYSCSGCGATVRVS